MTCIGVDIKTWKRTVKKKIINKNSGTMKRDVGLSIKLWTQDVTKCSQSTHGSSQIFWPHVKRREWSDMKLTQQGAKSESSRCI